MAVLSAVFKGVDEISAIMDRIADRGEQVVSQWETAGATADEAFERAAQGAEATASAAEAASSSTDILAAAIDNYDNSAQEAAEAVEGLNDASEAAARAFEDVGDASEEAGGQAEGFGNASVSAVRELSNVLAAAGIAKLLKEIYDGFAAAVDAAIEFESAITGVYKTVDGTDEQLASINSEIKAMALSMPASTTEIAEVAEAAGQLGIATENITYFTEVMINLGEATNLTAEQAATSLAKFSNITGMAAANYESLGSTVVALGNNFATTEADIVAMSTRMASAGTLAGLTEPEILALAAAMSSVGIEADAGGSAMSKLLTDIQVSVETGSERLEDFAAVAGMTGDQFAEAFGESAAGALYAFIDGLNDVERNGETATVILENMGLTEVRLSNAIKSLASNSDGLASAIGVANMAWTENTALATEANLRYSTLESRMSMAENAANNVAIAIGDDLTPAIGGFVDIGTGVLEWIAGVIEGSPAVTALLTGTAVAVGVVAVAFTAYTAATTIATAITTAFGVASLAALWPLYLVAAAIGAVVAAAVLITNAVSEANAEFNGLTAVSKQHRLELDALNAEYEETAALYGENSEQARRLAEDIAGLEAVYEATKMTLEEFTAKTDALLDSHDALMESYRTSADEINKEEKGAAALIGKLEQLASATDRSAAEQFQMEAIVGKLNEQYPDLALSIDETTGALNKSVEAMRALAEAEAQEQRMNAQHQAYVEALSEEVLLREQIAIAEANLNAERERARENIWLGTSNTDDPFVRLLSDCDEYEDALAGLELALEENLALQKETEEAYEAYARAAEEAARATVDYETAVSRAVSSVSEEMAELAEKYDEAYEAARSSIDSTIGIFDKMATECEISINDMLTAMQSQVDYLATYTENLQKAAQYGLDDGLIASLSDGSEESAGYINAIINQIERLGGTTERMSEDAAAFVEQFNGSFQEVEAAKDEFAGTVAAMETDFNSKMDEIEGRLTEAIDNMNMEADAAAAAKDTIQAYVDQIRSMTGDAHDAAAAVAAATTNALGGGNVAVGVTGYASGTTSAERGVKLVGEDGPELVLFDGGETVIDADRTDRILSASTQRPLNVQPPVGFDTEAGSSGTSEKKITLEIDGKGSLDISGGVDEGTVLDLLFEHMKPVLLSIIRKEVFEEGELAYEF